MMVAFVKAKILFERMELLPTDLLFNLIAQLY